MPTATQIKKKNISKTMRRSAEKLIDNAAIKAEDILKQCIWDTVYTRPCNMYERTEDFYDSIQTIKEDYYGKGRKYNYTGIKAEIYSDWQSMSLVPAQKTSDGYIWGKHMGVKGQDYRRGMFFILNDGPSSPVYTHEPAQFYEMTQQAIENTVFKMRGKVADVRAISKMMGGKRSGVVIRHKF